MPQRHGVVVSHNNSPQCRLGVWQIFDPWVKPGLLVKQGYNTRHPEKRPQVIEYHFRRVVYRLLRSLGSLHQHAREYSQFLEAGALAGPNPVLIFEIPEEAGIAVDSVFHYLTLFIDDLARIIPYVLTEEGDKLEEPDGFSELKKQLIQGQLPTSQAVMNLFVALDQNESWWSLGFKRSVGIRQRLTHYTDLVYFGGSTKAGDSVMTSDISLTTIGGPVHIGDFENALQNLLTGLCEWLDQLDRALLSRLSERLGKKGVLWKPFDERIPAVMLPGSDNARFEARHYLYLPMCSEP